LYLHFAALKIETMPDACQSEAFDFVLLVPELYWIKTGSLVRNG
jgi:hypothetical protein